MKVANGIVNASKININSQTGTENKKPFESRIHQSVGLKDISKAWTAYQNKEYESALKNAGLGSLKLSMIAFACYGVYKWATGNVVHINDFITQADKDFYSQGHRSFVPSSVAHLFDAMYDEQKTFAKWPKSIQKFVTKHLNENTLMSSAIVKHLFEMAALKGDRTFERYAIKTCQSATITSNSCLTAVEYYTGASNPEGLRNAMNLVGKCRKIPNTFCEHVFENAKTLSVTQKSISDVLSLGQMMTHPKAKTDLTKSKSFIEKAAHMFDQEMGEIQKAIVDCDQMKAGDAAAGKICYNRANWFKTTEAWASRIVGKSDQWKREYGAKQAKILQDQLREAITGYVGFAKVCSKIPDSQPCQQHIDQSIAMYRTHREALGKSLNDCSNVDIDNDVSWNRCYNHANFLDQLEALNVGYSRGYKERYASKKAQELKEELQKSLSGYGVSLTEACAKFSSSKSCQRFPEEIIQKLIDYNLPNDALKVVTVLPKSIGFFLDRLARKNQWEQGVRSILSFAKKNPALDIQSSIATFWTCLMNSNEAYRAFELLSLNDRLDIETTLAKAFANKDEDHLHRVYLFAKSWIAKKDKKYDDHLKFIIRQLFAVNPSYSSPWNQNIEKEMAKVLVTQWMQSINPNIKFTDLYSPWRLSNKPNSKWDRYSDMITEKNWERKLDDALNSSK